MVFASMHYRATSNHMAIFNFNQAERALIVQQNRKDSTQQASLIISAFL